MSLLLQCRALGHTAGTKPLFNGVDLSIKTKDRVGLVGHNGSGKSTLLAILSGKVQPDSGDLHRSTDLSLEVVEQFIPETLNDLTLFAALTDKLPVAERDWRGFEAEKLLAIMGFNDTELNYLVRDLSGGQQNRLMFARAVINEPDLILFDEPTNHLDLKTMMLFESFLLQLKSAYLIISHDRQFLDTVTERTIFIRDERSYQFDLPYSDARMELDAMDSAAAHTRAAEEKMIAALDASARRLAMWGKVYDNEKLAKKAKTMQKRIERLEEDKTFVSKGAGLHLSLEVETSKANRMLHIEDCHIEVGKQSLFYIEDLYIRPGDRVALLGHNGAGKTTLIKQLVDRKRAQDHTVFRFNPQVQIGYYDQELELLDPNLSLMETLVKHCPGADRDYINALINAGFPFKEHDKLTRVLSGGEKARLVFLVIRLNKPNFLILDEPTNHIDIEGKEQLEEQLLHSNATVIITSHDRRFVDEIATRYLMIDQGRLTEINDPISFYQAMAETKAAKKVSASAATSPVAANLDDAEQLLEQIVQLETLLSEDQARKARFQKPDKQAAWQQQLKLLNQQLEQLDADK